jgi:hypothetical protein
MATNKLATSSGSALSTIRQQSVDAVRLLFVRKVPSLGKDVAASSLRKASQGAVFPGFIS